MSNSLTTTTTATAVATAAGCAPVRLRKAKGTGVASKLPHQVLRRNERERKRVQQVNLGFISLRDRVPQSSTSKKLSKVETLREAARYIRHLQELLQMPVRDETDGSPQAETECKKYILPTSVQDNFCPSGPSNSVQNYYPSLDYDRQQYYLSYNGSDSAYSSPTYSNLFSVPKNDDISPDSSCASELSAGNYRYLSKSYAL